MTRVDATLLIALARQESAFNPTAISHAGAMGLLQVMPETANEVLGFASGSEESKQPDILNPKTNAEVGSAYLANVAASRGQESMLWLPTMPDPRRCSVGKTD